MQTDLKKYEVWLVTGSQHLYGEETLKNVAHHAREIAQSIGEQVPVTFQFRTVVTTPDEVLTVCRQANNTDTCIGLVIWMHTFSPAKMWINGLQLLDKPLAHLHTQYHAEIPWLEIDMDFMNENQSAHGDREFGFLMTRLRKNRKVIVGHWRDQGVVTQLTNWMRVAIGWHIFQHMKVARIGDNMREVAVTEGDKVEAQIRFGFSVNGYGISELVAKVKQVTDHEIDQLLQEYQDLYQIREEVAKSQSLRDAAQIEIGLRAFMRQGGFEAFTDTFENLNGLKQLPGLAVQRLMADGYG
ncbi:MAG: L-arabinose isomerase, partial [Bacteroidota bacterium]